MAAFLLRMLERVADVDFGEVPWSGGTPFEDIGLNSPETQRAIYLLWALDIANGTGDGTTWSGSRTVTRGQMAAFLTRLQRFLAEDLDEGAASPFATFPTGGAPFADDSGVFEADVRAVAAAGVAAGRSDGTFGAAAPVTRGQMALFLARTVDLWAEQDGPYQVEDNGHRGLPVRPLDFFPTDVPVPERGLTFVRPGELQPATTWRVGFVPASAVVLDVEQRGDPGRTYDVTVLRFRPEAVSPQGLVDLGTTSVRVTHVDAMALDAPAATVDVPSAPYGASDRQEGAAASVTATSPVDETVVPVAYVLTPRGYLSYDEGLEVRADGVPVEEFEFGEPVTIGPDSRPPRP